MLSTVAMVQLGSVYGNLMVNVQLTNAKLVDRGQRIVMAITGVDQPAAAQLLTEAGNVKLAIVMQKLSLTREAAETRLTAAQGSLREACPRFHTRYAELRITREIRMRHTTSVPGIITNRHGPNHRPNPVIAPEAILTIA